MSRDSWTDLITHHIWLYMKKGARNVRIVRKETSFERRMTEARIRN